MFRRLNSLATPVSPFPLPNLEDSDSSRVSQFINSTLLGEYKIQKRKKNRFDAMLEHHRHYQAPFVELFQQNLKRRVALLS